MRVNSILSSAVFASALASSALTWADLPTVRVESRQGGATHVAEASIEAVNQVTVSAQMAGRVVELRVDAGDAVLAGERLLRIDASEASQAVVGAEAVVAQARAGLANARAEYERARALAERGFISESVVDQTRTAFEAAQAQLRSAQAGRSQSEVVLGYADVASPLTGIVSERHVEPGEMAQPGTRLLTIFDPTAMRAVVDVPQSRLAGIEPGSVIASVELPDSGRRVEATRVTVMPAADARTYTLRLRIDLPADLDRVMPGAFARVYFTVGDATRIVVPASSILRRSEVTGVYVVDPRTGFSLRQIRLGEPVGDGMVEVLSGLNGSEEIALDPIQAGIVARAARAAGR
ncbi:efflux RND transporter periplasmic adaptor subunit [Rhodocyclaceae bacterium SMB388]